MILSIERSARLHSAEPEARPQASAMPIAGWLRRSVTDQQGLLSHTVEDVALVAGAAVGALDAMVRRDESSAGVWRQRLALAAAAVAAKQSGRVEDEASLRDAVLLTRPADFVSVGPAGRLLLAWRRLATRPAGELLTAKSVAAMVEEFGYARDDVTAGHLADELRPLAAAGTVGMLTGAFDAAERHGFGRAVGRWLADAILAQRLGWVHAVPVTGTDAASATRGGNSRRPASVSGEAELADDGPARAALAALTRGALRAVDLSADLERRAEHLLSVAPKLRAKGAERVIGRLLSDDAIVASQQIAGISDRGLRRLFDRLVDLGAVRELSGRPAFRIYGL